MKTNKIVITNKEIRELLNINRSSATEIIKKCNVIAKNENISYELPKGKTYRKIFNKFIGESE